MPKYKKVKCGKSEYLIDLEEIIGTGAYGKVYRAYYISPFASTISIENIDTQICVKQIDIENKKEKLIRDEISSYKKIFESKEEESPCMKYFAELYDYYSNEKDLVYIFMQYCPGITLENVLNKNPQKKVWFDESEIKNFLYQLTQALEFIHSKNIYHRDIKPQNIMVTIDLPLKSNGSFIDTQQLIDKDILKTIINQKLNYKIIDFGVALHVQNINEVITLNDTSGSPFYMAPEALQGEKTTEGKIDIWSLGVIAYLLLFTQGTNMKNLYSMIYQYQLGNNDLQYPDTPKRVYFFPFQINLYYFLKELRVKRYSKMYVKKGLPLTIIRKGSSRQTNKIEY